MGYLTEETPNKEISVKNQVQENFIQYCQVIATLCFNLKGSVDNSMSSPTIVLHLL